MQSTAKAQIQPEKMQNKQQPSEPNMCLPHFPLGFDFTNEKPRLTLRRSSIG